jgi:hypothetical protein
MSRIWSDPVAKWSRGGTKMTDTWISRALLGADRKLRPIIRALIYAALAFWFLSADEFLGPPLSRAATALHATGLSPSRRAFYETINFITALLLTWIFGLYEGRRVDDYGLPIRQAFGARFWEGFAVGVVHVCVPPRQTTHSLPTCGSDVRSLTRFKPPLIELLTFFARFRGLHPCVIRV